MNIIKQNNQEQIYNQQIQVFNDEFSQYVSNNLKDKYLHINITNNYMFDNVNKLLYLPIQNISSYFSLQPILYLNNNMQIINLNFNMSLNNNVKFAYLYPYQYTADFFNFSYTLFFLNSFIDNNTLNYFYQIINNVDQSLSNYIMTMNNNQTIINNQIEEKENEDNNAEEDNNDSNMSIFIQKYRAMIVDNTHPDIINEKMILRNNIYENISKVLNNRIIGQTFKYDKFLDTFENYSAIFDSMHLDQHIHLLGHYYEHLSIKPIIEFSFAKNTNEIHDMVTIDFFKFEISYFNPQQNENKFEETLTIIPYEFNNDFRKFLDLIIVLQFHELPIYNNLENENERFNSIDLVPFLEALFDELLKTFELIKNPLLKRKSDSNFLKNDPNFNEKDLDRYL